MQYRKKYKRKQKKIKKMEMLKLAIFKVLRENGRFKKNIKEMPFGFGHHIITAYELKSL